MKLHLKILTPEAILLQDHVDSVQVPAVDGVYEILPHHAPIFMKLHAGGIVVYQSGEIEHWFINKGSCHMYNNTCTVLAREVIDANELDLNAIETLLKLNAGSSFCNEKRQLLESQIAYKKAYKNT